MTENSSLISVIVPAYNAENTIVHCVDSILKQSYNKIEIIIVDDASTDATYDICQKKFGKENRIKLYQQKNNSGVSAARNVGLEHANGDYVAFCDADDTMETQMLDTLLTYASKSHADIVCCAHDKVGAWPATVQSVIMDEKKKMAVSVGTYGGFVWNKLFSKKVLDNVRFDENLSLCEDTVFVTDCIYKKKNCKMEYIPEVLYHYSMGGVTAGASDTHFRNNSYCYEDAMLRAALYADDVDKQYYRHKTFMLAVVERDFDKRYHVLSGENRRILKEVIRRNRAGFLKDSEISFQARIIFYARYLFPYSKYLKRT